MDKLNFACVSRNYFNMPVWIAEDAGLFAEEGLAVAIEHIESVDEVTDRLRQGHAQLVYGISEHVVLDHEAGGKQQIIGGNVNRLPFSLISQSSIKTIADLRGKTIGVSSLEAGSSSLIIELLKQSGLSYPDDYKMEAVGPILARWDKLQSGAIDAGLQGAPLNYIAMDQGYHSLCEPRHIIPDFQFTSLHANHDWAEAHADLVIRFMRAFIRAHRWFTANKEGCRNIAMARTGISAHYADRAWDDYVADGIFPVDGNASTAALQSLINISGLIRAIPHRIKTSADDYINRRYWTDALSGLV
jgi:ABC-type nitrate/sulfonate/bicarbonate transport system substrate-binding protein